MNWICRVPLQKVQNEAFRFAQKPIYCTQFHPELNKIDLLDEEEVNKLVKQLEIKYKNKEHNK